MLPPQALSCVPWLWVDKARASGSQGAAKDARSAGSAFWGLGRRMEVPPEEFKPTIWLSILLTTLAGESVDEMLRHQGRTMTVGPFSPQPGLSTGLGGLLAVILQGANPDLPLSKLGKVAVVAVSRMCVLMSWWFSGGSCRALASCRRGVYGGGDYPGDHS
jgi:hypothetical protein